MLSPLRVHTGHFSRRPSFASIFMLKQVPWVVQVCYRPAPDPQCLAHSSCMLPHSLLKANTIRNSSPGDQPQRAGPAQGQIRQQQGLLRARSSIARRRRSSSSRGLPRARFSTARRDATAAVEACTGPDSAPLEDATAAADLQGERVACPGPSLDTALHRASNHSLLRARTAQRSSCIRSARPLHRT